MINTDPSAASKFRQLIMAKSQEERLTMGCSMFSAAKQIVKSAILNENPKITPGKMKEEIFLRFYGMEFDKLQKEKIQEFVRSCKTEDR